MVKYTKKQIDALWNSIRSSYDELGVHRSFRQELIKEYAGPAYFTKAGKNENREMNNVWALAIETINLAIAGGDPQVQLFTAIEEWVPFAADFEAVINAELEKMEFGQAIQDWVLEALFGLGVMKIGKSDSTYLHVRPGFQASRGSTLFADVVDLDCWVHDSNAARWSEIDFCGDRYRCSLEVVKDNEDYDPAVRKMVMANRDASAVLVGNLTDGPKADPAQNKEQFFDYVDLWDIFIPRHQVIITLVDGQRELPPLAVKEWKGPPNFSGPYYLLSASKVPGNCMPKTPGHHLKPLHDLINRLWKKLSRQAGKQKSIVAVEDGAQQDGEKIRDAEDCSVVPLTSIDRMKVVELLGPHQGNMAFASLAFDTFNRLAGNIEAMGGLGPQSSTVGQDELIMGTVSKRVAKLQQRTVSETIRIVKDLALYIWNSDESYTAHRKIDGLDIYHRIALDPGSRDGDFGDYDFSISPFSVRYQAPGERGQTILQLVQSIVMPALPVMAQSGVQLNWQRLFQLLAKEMSLPEFNNLFESNPNPYIASGNDSPPAKAPVTTRNYVRTSRPAASREGNTQSLMQMAAGSGVQQSQSAALMRGTGT